MLLRKHNKVKFPAKTDEFLAAKLQSLVNVPSGTPPRARNFSLKNQSVLAKEIT